MGLGVGCAAPGDVAEVFGWCDGYGGEMGGGVVGQDDGDVSSGFRDSPGFGDDCTAWGDGSLCGVHVLDADFLTVDSELGGHGEGGDVGVFGSLGEDVFEGVVPDGVALSLGFVGCFVQEFGDSVGAGAVGFAGGGDSS